MLRKIAARTLLNYTVEQLWGMLTGEFTLCFDDGEIQTNSKETLYSAYTWRLHKEYPKTPLLIKHHVQHTLKGGNLGSKTHLILLGDVMWSTHEAYIDEIEGVHLRDILSNIVYQITNEIYNDLSYRVEDYVVSLDILDFIEVIEHPEIVPIQASLTPDQASIDREYKALTTILKSKDKIPHNAIARAVQANLVDMNQVLQCLGSRGYITDIDSVLFNTPIIRGYVRGLRSLYDSLIESRSSAKALFFSKSPLEDAEYFSRKLQLLCQIVETVHPGDCGSQHYLIWNVRPPTHEDKVEILTEEVSEDGVEAIVALSDKDKIETYKGDLNYLVGKHYLDEETNQLKVIKRSDTHLNNKTIKIRSVVAGCDHPDPHGLCSVCFGDLYYSVPANTNIGHMCATSMTEKSSQSVLSTKHSDGSSVVNGIELPAMYRDYLDVTPDQSSYIMPTKLKGSSVKLIVTQGEASGLTDLSIVDNVNELNITRVSAITNLMIRITMTDPATGELTFDDIVIPVSLNKRLASFTYPFLQHIKTYGWEVDDKGNIIIDLQGWEYVKPIMTLPLKHFNMGDHSEDIAKIIESRVDDLVRRDTDGSPAATLMELFELVVSKLSVNLAVMEVIIYGASVVAARENNFNLPKPWTTKGLGVSGSTIAGRSLSSAMGYEGHSKTINNPASFFNENRPSLVMDPFVMPAESVADMDIE